MTTPNCDSAPTAPKCLIRWNKYRNSAYLLQTLWKTAILIYTYVMRYWRTFVEFHRVDSIRFLKNPASFMQNWILDKNLYFFRSETRYLKERCSAHLQRYYEDNNHTKKQIQSGG